MHGSVSLFRDINEVVVSPFLTRGPAPSAQHLIKHHTLTFQSTLLSPTKMRFSIVTLGAALLSVGVAAQNCTPGEYRCR